MNLRPSLLLVSSLILVGGVVPRPSTGRNTPRSHENVHLAAHRPPSSIRPDEPMATALDPAPTPPELLGPQPVDAYIRRALAENRTVQAARYNVLALKHRIPQVTALDDPVVSNTIFPSRASPPVFADGLQPLQPDARPAVPLVRHARGSGARRPSEDVQVALAELAAAQLDAVAAVKRAYYDLYFSRAGRGDPRREPQARERLP